MVVRACAQVVTARADRCTQGNRVVAVAAHQGFNRGVQRQGRAGAQRQCVGACAQGHGAPRHSGRQRDVVITRAAVDGFDATERDGVGCTIGQDQAVGTTIEVDGGTCDDGAQRDGVIQVATADAFDVGGGQGVVAGAGERQAVCPGAQRVHMAGHGCREGDGVGPGTANDGFHTGVER